MMFILMITAIQCLQISFTTLPTNISSPIDALLLPNSSFLIANQNSLYLFHPKTISIQLLSLPIKFPIINLASLPNYLAICTQQAIYLFNYNLTLQQIQSLSALKEYSHIAVISFENDIFYIPFSYGSLEFEQSKINSTLKRKFINQINLGKIQYLEGHRFVLATDQIGNIAIYNTSSTAKTDQAKLCNSQISSLEAIAGTSSILATCQDVSFIATQNNSLLQIEPIPYSGYPFAMMQDSYLLMINQTFLLVKNKSISVTQGFGRMTNIIHAEIIEQSNLTVFAFDDNGTILILAITNKEQREGRSGFPVWGIVAITSGGGILLVVVVIAIRRRLAQRKKESRYESQQSQLTLKLLNNDY